VPVAPSSYITETSMPPTSDASPVPALVVNANNISALLPIRALGRKGIPVTCVFGRGRRDQYAPVVRASRYISSLHTFDETDYEANLVQCLRDLGEKSRRKAVLYPASDLDMIIISGHRHSLEDYYHVLMPPHALLMNLLNKDWFYPFAAERGIPVPRTIHVSRPVEVDAAARRFVFPCIVKPAWRDEAWQAHYGNQKVLIAQDAEELRHLCHCLQERHYEMTVQEIIPGSEPNIVCSFTFLNERSEPLGVFTSQKIRQFPPHFGNSSLVQQVHDHTVVQLTAQICKQLGLVGYASIEFKRDDRDGTYKVIEITPCRFNRQAGLSESAGFSLPHVWYRHLLRQPIDCDVKSGVSAWVSEVNEVRAVWRYWRNGEYTLWEWLKSYRDVAQYEVFAKDDPLPFLKLVPSTLAHWVRRTVSLRPSQPVHRRRLISARADVAAQKRAS
jgi:predicted ATP-grasp superfamily ATP-dependent carboligase